MTSLVDLSLLLASRKISSRQLVDQSIAAIRNPEGEGSRAFLVVHAHRALAEADRVDTLRGNGSPLPVLAGVPISIKDLFRRSRFDDARRLEGARRISASDLRLRRRRSVETRWRDHHRAHEPLRVRLLGLGSQPALRYTEKTLSTDPSDAFLAVRLPAPRSRLRTAWQPQRSALIPEGRCAFRPL